MKLFYEVGHRGLRMPWDLSRRVGETHREASEFQCLTHYDSVRLGLVNSPLEWEYGWFRKFVEKGPWMTSRYAKGGFQTRPCDSLNLAQSP